MGHVKRQTFNEQLLSAIKYDDEQSVKNAIKRLIALEGLAERGDTVATSIMVDLKKALGMYGGSFLDLLTPAQRQVIIRVLIDDETQSDVAKSMGISQQGVSYLMSGGLKRIVKFLKTGRISWRRVTPAEKEFILTNYGVMPISQIAEKLQRSPHNCEVIYHNLIKERERNETEEES